MAASGDILAAMMRRSWLWIVMFAALGDGSAAAEVPVPRPRPALRAVTVAAIPVPRPRPVPAAADALKELRQPQTDAGDSGWPAAEIAAARQLCASELQGLDLVWQPDTPFGGPGGCGTAMPVAVSEAAGVRIDPPATVTCGMAAALHGWLEGSVKPAARSGLGKRVTGIRNAASFVCRPRNNVPGAKLSEHGKANALDIAAFVFAGEGEVTVAGNWSGVLQSIGLSGRGSFLRTVRRESCQYFSTVLGPGSDAYHQDHFHVDLAMRRNRGKYCR